MKYRHLGKSELKMSEVSFGCMSLQGDDASNARLLNSALENGINFFDTADLYQAGENEATLGKAFKGKRGKVIIATKVGNQLREDGSGWDWNPTKDYILEAIEKSLRRLQTDYIDLYQLHGGTIDDPIDETIEAFEVLKQQGKIRAYGISSIRPNVIREYVKRSAIASVMMQYSLLDRRPEEACLDLLLQHEIGVLARGSYAQGLLVGKEPKPYLDHSLEEVVRAANVVHSMVSPAQPLSGIAGRFVLHHPAVTSAVTGIRTREQLEEALQLSYSPVLQTGGMERLRGSVKEIRYDQHR